MVVLDEQIQFVREREHDVEVGDGQQELGLLRQPLGAFEPLAAGTVPIATEVGREVWSTAMGTLVMMAPIAGV